MLIGFYNEFMKSALVRYAIYGQACLYAGLVVCVIIRPAGLAANEGISYYGVYRQTIVPYVLAFLGSGYFAIKAGEHIHPAGLKTLKYSLITMGLLTMGLMITPSSLADGLHRVFGVSLFVLQLLLSGWFIIRLKYDYRAVVLTLMEFGGGLAAFIWLSPAQGYLLQAQVVFQLAFGGLLVYGLAHLVSSDRKKKSMASAG